MVYQFQFVNTMADIGEVDRDRGKFIINTCDADIVLCGNICSCDLNFWKISFLKWTGQFCKIELMIFSKTLVL